MAVILLVDDTPIMLETHGQILRAAGHEIITARSGLDALLQLERYTPDLIVLDYLMPGMDGDELLERIRARRETRATPALILTAQDESDQLARAIEVGVTAYMLKPVSRNNLVSRVAALLAARR